MPVLRLIWLLVSLYENPSVWTVAAEEEARARTNALVEQERSAAEVQRRREEIKRQSNSSQ